MAKIPVDESEQLIQVIDSVQHESLPRPYLGMSAIGEPCIRKLQYDWRMAYLNRHSARVQRIFDTGHRAEDFMIHDIHQAGGLVWGEQEAITGAAGHWGGHIDGMCNQIIGYEGINMLLEMKTHNDKSFKDVVKKRVEKSKPMHYDQMQRYMGGMDVEMCLYYAYNKNTSEYYIEFVKFDRSRFEELCEKEVTVIVAEELYPRVGNGSPTWHECRFCSAKGVCFGKEKIQENCRTCKHVDPCNDGKWECLKEPK